MSIQDESKFTYLRDSMLAHFTWRIKSLLSEHFALLDVDHLQGFFGAD